MNSFSEAKTWTTRVHLLHSTLNSRRAFSVQDFGMKGISEAKTWTTQVHLLRSISSARGACTIQDHGVTRVAPLQRSRSEA